MEEIFYQKFAIWVQMIFIILQTIGCISNLGSLIYTYKTFKVSKPIYLVAMLDSLVTFLGFLVLFGATMTLAIVTEKDPEFLKGKCVTFQFSLIHGSMPYPTESTGRVLWLRTFRFVH